MTAFESELCMAAVDNSCRGGGIAERDFKQLNIDVTALGSGEEGEDSDLVIHVGPPSSGIRVVIMLGIIMAEVRHRTRGGQWTGSAGPDAYVLDRVLTLLPLAVGVCIVPNKGGRSRVVDSPGQRDSEIGQVFRKEDCTGDHPDRNEQHKP